jgi:hypothetical protein
MQVNFGLAYGFHDFEAIKFVSVLTLNVLSGSYWYVQFVRKGDYSLPELIGCGIAIGTLVPALMNLILKSIGIHSFNATAMFLFISGVVFLIRKLDLSNKTYSLSQDDLSLNILLLVLPIANYYTWGFNLHRYLFFGLSLIIFVLIVSKISDKYVRLNSYVYRPKVNNLWTSSLIVVLTVSHIVSNPSNSTLWREFVGVDIAIDESISWGVTNYGMGENVLLSGNPLHLHALSHAWSGDFSQLINADNFMISGVGGYFVGLIGISFLLFAIGKRISGSAVVGLISSMVYFLQASMPEELIGLPAPRMANSISMLWLLFALYLISGWDHSSRLRKLVAIPAFVGVLTMSKAQWGLMFMVVALWMLSPKKWWTDVRFISLSVIGSLTFFLVYGFVISSSASDHATKPESLFAFDLASLSIVLTVLFFRTPLLLRSKRSIDCFQEIWLKAYYACLLFLPIIVLTNGGYLSTYFYFPLLAISAPLIANQVIVTYDSCRKFLWTYVLFIAGTTLGFLGLASVFYARFRFLEANRTDIFAFFVVDYPQLISLICIVFVVGMSLLIFSTRIKPINFDSWLKNIPHIVIVSIVSINLGIFIAHGQKNLIIRSVYDIETKNRQLLTDEQIEVGTWLNEETHESSVIGSNIFCSNLLHGLRFEEARGADCRTRNEFAWISSTSRRRSFLEAPVFSLGNIMSKSDQERYRYSISFGENGSGLSLEYLRKSGVNYFVLDKAMTSSAHWVNDSKIVFENSEFVVLKIK